VRLKTEQELKYSEEVEEQIAKILEQKAGFKHQVEHYKKQYFETLKELNDIVPIVLQFV